MLPCAPTHDRIAGGTTAALHTLGCLLAEIAELRRVRSAQAGGQSVAAQRFAHAWGRLVAGADPDTVAVEEIAAAAAHAVLGPIDAVALADAGLTPARRADVLATAIARGCAMGGLEAPAEVIEAAERLACAIPTDPPPAFVALLAAQPRAGAVAADVPRLVLTPQENHAEHCWSVAVMAALLPGRWQGAADAAPGTRAAAFLLGLAHHFPNAWLPDGGFAAEVVLADDLDGIFARFNDRALAMLPPALSQHCAAALVHKDTADTAVGRVFNAADVIDRVLQQRHHEAQARFRLSDATEARGLVHAGPLQPFQTAVLAEAALL